MLNEIKGVGPKTIEGLKELNINTLNDLITYYPYRYNIYKPIRLIDAKDNEIVTITGNVSSPVKVFFIKRNLNRLSFNMLTNNKLIKVVIFNRAFVKQYLEINKLISIIGKYDEKTNTFTASDLKLTPITTTVIEPVYHLNSKIKRNIFSKMIESALTKPITNYIPEEYNTKYNFIDKTDAVKEIHTPSSLEALKNSKVSLIYEELFNFMLKINYLKTTNRKINSRDKKIFDEQKIEEFINSLPFTLTNDQINAIEDIKKDFNQNNVMNRLLLGDVGSGKTIIAFISLYMNYLSGYEGILMAPTEILAHQHYENMVSLFKNINIHIALLTSSTKKKEQEDIINKIKNKEIDVLIGTHSVLNNNLVFSNLGLVITDEQHRFGVKQRLTLKEKGKNTDILYMSATPIPRTLALTIYGDMDITNIKTKPSNRKPITTKIIKNKDIKIVLNEMLEEIKNNHQIYVVAPLIEDENNTQMENVKELENKIDTAFNHKVPIGLLHGKIKAKEKEQIMTNWQNNKIKILISTTVVEVGVDVKNATMMVIFNAERFGLATLHQLRGRIGRNDLESKCFLISDYESQRLKVLEESCDGFYISEKDFELRGTGDLFGIRQSGEMQFKIANLKTDYKILGQCQKDSLEFLNNHLKEIDAYPNQKEVLESLNKID